MRGRTGLILLSATTIGLLAPAGARAAYDVTAFNLSTGTVTFSGDQGGSTADSLTLDKTTVGGQALLRHNLIGNGGVGNYADATDIDPSAGVAHLVDGSGTAPLISVNAGTGSDKLFVGSSSGGVPSAPLSTAVQFDGGVGSDELNVVVTANTFGGSYGLTGTSVSGFGGSLSFTNTEVPQIFGGSGPDVFNVAADAPASSGIHGGEGADRLVLADGADVGTVDGQGGSDTLDYSGYTTAVVVAQPSVTGVNASATGLENFIGGSAGDTLTGTADANTLSGGPGGDQLTGGANADSFDGGSGNDTINAQDGAADSAISCGDGTADVLNADSVDPEVATTDCETQNIAAAGGDGGGGSGTGTSPTGTTTSPPPSGSTTNSPTGTQSTPTVRGKSSAGTATVNPDGAFTLPGQRVNCPPRGASCAVSTRVTGLITTSARRKLRLGGSKFRVSPDKTSKVRVKLTKTGLRLLKRKGTIKAVVRIVVIKGTVRTVKKVRVTLKAPTRRR